MCTADLQKEGVDEDDVEGITFFSSKKALSADTAAAVGSSRSDGSPDG